MSDHHTLRGNIANQPEIRILLMPQLTRVIRGSIKINGSFGVFYKKYPQLNHCLL